MRRPILFLLLTYILGHLAYIQLSWALVGLVIYLMCFRPQGRQSKWLLLSSLGLIFGLLNSMAYDHKHLKLAEGDLNQTRIEGIFYEASVLNDSSGMLKVDMIGNPLNQKRIKLYSSKSTPLILPKTGSRVAVYGKITEPQFPRNRYRFDERLYLASKGVTATMFVSQFELLQRGDSMEQWRGSLLAASVERLYRYTALDQGNIAIGMLLGVDDHIDEITEASFKKTGLMHLLSISGAHFAVLFHYLNRVTESFKRSYKLRKGLNYSCILFFVWLIGFPMAAVRALLMFFMLEALRLCRRQPDGLNALAYCIALILIYNPFAFWDIGLQLASLAMLAILCFLPLCQRLIGLESLKAAIKLQEAHDPYYSIKLKSVQFISELYTGFIVSIVMMPLLAHYFYQVQWIGILVGPLLTLLATAYLPLGAIQLILPIDFLNTALGSLSGLLLKLMTTLSLWLSSYISYEGLPSGGSLSLGLLICALALVLAYKQRELLMDFQHRRPALLGLCVLLLIAAVEIPQFASPLVLKSLLTGRPQVIAIDVGQGDSTLIITSEGKTILVDAGLEKGRLQVCDSLLSLGIRKLDYLVLTHAHDDHYGGMTALAEQFRIGHFIYYENSNEPLKADPTQLVLEKLREKGTVIKALAQGDSLQLGKHEYMDVLWPPKSAAIHEVNDRSLVLNIRFKRLQLLLTGDISSDVEYDIIGLVPSAPTILKLAHHGSRYSNGTELLSLPGLFLTYSHSGLNNRYKHPHQETLTRVEAQGLPILNTQTMGAVRIEIWDTEIEYISEGLRAKGQWR